nr:GNAT family N-acetyltransferase [uncultured Cetobacterium sp.]
MKVVEVTSENRDLIKKIYENEIESFGVMGGADMWMIMSFIRYGKLYVLLKDDELLAVAQFQKIMKENGVFLYGFSTVEKHRNKGYAKYLLKETEKRLKEINIESIYLTVDPNNEIAVNMYKKLGYKILEFQEDEYGEGIHRYLMYKRL